MKVKVNTEAATGGVLQKKVFLKIAQNSKEKTSASLFFENIFLTEQIRATASVYSNILFAMLLHAI